MTLDLGQLMERYLAGGSAAASAGAEDHFHSLSQTASPQAMKAGIEAMFRSDATPSFGDMAGRLFGSATPAQQGGTLNALIAGMGPKALGSLLAGGAGSSVAGMLGGMLCGGEKASIGDEQAAQFTPAQVAEIAAHAERHDAGIVARMSSFYVDHPMLVKTLGGAALSVALARMVSPKATT